MKALEEATVTKIHNIAFLEHMVGGSGTMTQRNCYGLSFGASGYITFEQDSTRYDLTPNSALLLPKGSKYSWKCHKTGLFPQINFETEHPITEKITRLEIGSFAAIEGRLKALQNAILTASNAKAMSIFYDLIDVIARNNGQGSRILTDAIEYLHKNYSDASLTNKILADKAKISEIYFRRLFKESFGVSPKKYIIDLRLKKAKNLLSEGFNSIGEVAEVCGFSSVYHFCRAFKEKTGSTPTEYAKTNYLHSHKTI